MSCVLKDPAGRRGGSARGSPGWPFIFPGLRAESSPPCFISATALVRNRNELRGLRVEGWPMPLVLSPRAYEGREPRVGQGCAHPRMCSPTSRLGPSSGVSKRVAGRLPTPPVPAGAPSSTGPGAPLGRLSPAEAPVLLLGLWPVGQRRPLDTGHFPPPTHEAISGGLRMSCLSRHQGLEKGGSDPCRAAFPLPTPRRRPSSPARRAPGPSVRGALPGPLARLA